MRGARLAPALIVALFVAAAAQPRATGGASDTGSPEWAAAREVLETSCLSCHDSERAKGGLDLSSRESFARGGDRGAVYDPDRWQASPLVTAIRYTDADLEMPPRGKLSPPEIAVLEAWLRVGAPWPSDAVLENRSGHEEPTAISLDEGRESWAYRPPVAPPVPTAVVGLDSDHPIDRFIAARLADAGLTMNPPADPRTLLRRVSYGLTGLPPTFGEVAAFEEDPSDEAWQREIERRLGTRAYGEHWARHWLDLVRFAETNGYERDTTKLNMWRYRDYLIRAFADDKPYDEFLIEQLAGDEWNAVRGVEDPDALLATGYHRLMIWDDEPADPAQARADVIADVVDTTGLVFLGTTVGCARCHDHKMDPISQRDYYSMFAFFNNLSDHGVGEAITRPVPDPQRPDGPPAWSSSERDRHVAELDRALDAVLSELERAWATTRAADPEPMTLVADARTSGHEWRFTTTKATDWATPGFDDSSWSLGRSGFGREGTPGARIGTAWLTSDLYLRTRFALTEIPAALTLAFHHDEDFTVFLNGVPVFERRGYRGDYETIQLGPEARDALVVGSNVIAVHCHQTSSGQFIDVGLGTGLLPGRERPVWIERLTQHGAELLPPAAHRRGEELLVQIREATVRPVREAYPAPIAFEKGANPPEQTIHGRGSVHASGEAVVPSFPAVLVPAGEPTAATIEPIPGGASSGRRLAFARWLVSPDHPLTAKVMVNRVWQFHFGRGLVRSSSDFGGLGTGPTHPELLDYLAHEFVRNDWSLSWLHRTILTSETYRMSSRAQDDALRRDPTNELLWRFDLRRLRAEEIRDTILTVNGTVNPASFGPSFYSKLPREVLETASRPDQAWGNSTEAERDRRSLYIFTKRSLRDPFLESFDQADTDMSCAARLVTNVPTQTLTLLNSDLMAEESALFAKRLRAEVPLDTAAPNWAPLVDRALELALVRPATDEERHEYSAFLDRLMREHGLSVDAAVEAFALLVYNLNEFLFLD